MKRAYTLSEAARELGIAVREAAELVTLVFGQRRDVLSLTELGLLRDAHGASRTTPARSRLGRHLSEVRQELGGAATVTLKKEGKELVAAHGRRRWNISSGQGLLDLGTGAGTPWLNPGPRPDPDALFARAVAAEEHDVRQAIDLYLQAVAACPTHADSHVNLGRLLHQEGRLREAEAHYVAALVARPRDLTALFNLAVVMEDLGHLDQAIARYLEVLQLEPGSVDACFNLARLYEKKGEKMAAIRHLKDYRRLTSRL